MHNCAFANFNLTLNATRQQHVNATSITFDDRFFSNNSILPNLNTHKYCARAVVSKIAARALDNPLL
jgi:hypothetical protein